MLASANKTRDCVNLTAFAILLYKMSDTERELNANYYFFPLAKTKYDSFSLPLNSQHILIFSFSLFLYSIRTFNMRNSLDIKSYHFPQDLFYSVLSTFAPKIGVNKEINSFLIAAFFSIEKQRTDYGFYYRFVCYLSRGAQSERERGRNKNE